MFLWERLMHILWSIFTKCLWKLGEVSMSYLEHGQKEWIFPCKIPKSCERTHKQFVEWIKMNCFMCHYGRGHLFVHGFKCNSITSSNDLYWKHNKSQYTVIDGNIPSFLKKKKFRGNHQFWSLPSLCWWWTEHRKAFLLELWEGNVNHYYFLDMFLKDLEKDIKSIFHKS